MDFFAQCLWPMLFAFPLSAASAEEKQLFKDLFETGYVPDVRPRIDPSQTVTVNVELDLNQIKELDEKTEVLHFVAFLETRWYDDYLKWNPQNYSGIREVIVPPDHVWLPDFGILNSVETFYQDTFFTHFRVHVNYTGLIKWSFGGHLETSCDIDTTLFPFDSQRCSVILENWAYNLQYVDLQNTSDGIRLDGYHDNGIWHLVSTAVVRREVNFTVNPDIFFPQLEFFMFLQRKPRYYLINIMLPCVFLISIALLVFWLPPDAGEKVSLGVTVLLAFSVFQLVISESTPENSDCTPLLSVFVTLTMGLSTVSVVTTIFVLYLHHRGAVSPVPDYLYFVAFGVVSRALCMRIQLPSRPARQERAERRLKDGTAFDDEAIELRTDGGRKNGPITPPTDDCVRCSWLGCRVDDVAHELRKITARMVRRDEDLELASEWRALAKVVDRVLFWVTLLVLVFSLLWMLARSQEQSSHMEDLQKWSL